MAPTWREERPEAITAASHKAVRPSRSMVTTFSALSSSSETRMRFSRSLCGAAFRTGAAAFLRTGFLAAFFGDFFVADFRAGTFLAAFALAFFAVFAAALRVRAWVLCVQETR